MKAGLSVPEAVDFIKEIQNQPEKLFVMIVEDVREAVGKYMTKR